MQSLSITKPPFFFVFLLMNVGLRSVVLPSTLVYPKCGCGWEKKTKTVSNINVTKVRIRLLPSQPILTTGNN